MINWKERKLSDISDIQTGPFGSMLHQSDYVENGTPIVTVEHLGNKRFKTQNLPMVSELDTKRLSKYALRVGDIVFSRVGSVDRCSYVSIDENNWLFSGRCLRVRANKEAFSEFLYYFFCMESTKEHIRKIAVGATMPSINTSIMKGICINLPPLPEQKAIAAILSLLDDKIDLLTRQNETLEALASMYFRQWFTEGQDMVRLGDYFPVKTGKQDANIATDDGEYLFFTCSKEPLRTDSYSFNEPSILLAGNGDFNVKWYRGKFEAYQRTYVLTPYNPDNLPWLYFAISYHLNDITNGHRGSVINFITKGMIEDFTITLPAVSNFNRFKYLANDILTKQESNHQQISIIKRLRDTLLPKLIRGELRVNQ